jgi:Ca2+-binding EF-hand superfamily protein
MKKATWLITALLMTAGIVLAAGTPENFKKHDTNEDGIMEKAEYMAMRAKWKKDPAESEEIFNHLDKDKNGELTFEEFTEQK